MLCSHESVQLPISQFPRKAEPEALLIKGGTSQWDVPPRAGTFHPDLERPTWDVTPWLERSSLFHLERSTPTWNVPP